MADNSHNHTDSIDSNEYYSIEIGSELDLGSHDTIIEAFQNVNVNELRLVDEYGNVVAVRGIDSEDSEEDGSSTEQEDEIPSCPECERTGAVYERETKSPKYRCNTCKVEFDDESEDNRDEPIEHNGNYPTCEECGQKVSKGLVESNYPHDYAEYASGKRSIKCRTCGDRPWETDHYNSNGVTASDSK